MKVFVRVRVKTWAYLMDYDSEKKRAKGTEKCIIKKELVKNYKDCLFNNKIILKSQQAFTSNHHDV